MYTHDTHATRERSGHSGEFTLMSEPRPAAQVGQPPHQVGVLWPRSCSNPPRTLTRTRALFLHISVTASGATVDGALAKRARDAPPSDEPADETEMT